MFPIAYVAGQFPLTSETFVWREVRALRSLGWDVHTFALNRPATVSDDLRDLEERTTYVYEASPLARAMAALRHPTPAATALLDVGRRDATRVADRLKLPAQAAAGAWLADELRRRGVRHVHAHFAHAPASVAMYAARAAGLPFSFTGHANDLFQRRQHLATKLRRAAFVACISEWHRDLYRSLVPRPDDAYPIVRCGVEVPSSPIELRAQIPNPRLLTVARLVEKKGTDTLVRVLVDLPDATLTIVGDGPLRALLEALSREIGVASRTTFLGMISNDRVRMLLAEHDVFALLCRVDSKGDKDGIPVVLMEAMAAGLPVIAGDLRSVCELVRDGDTGFIVQPNFSGFTAEAIRRLSADADLRHRLAEAGRRHVVAEFSLSGNVERLAAAFSRAAG